jgi:beta-galactosidase
LAGSLSALAEPREVASLDADWRFFRGDLPGVESEGPPPAASPATPTYDDSAWRVVAVPHDYIVEGSFDSKADALHASLPVETAWYRKRIAIPTSAQGRRLWLEFDGVYRDSRMWFNGHFLGRHESGYTSFRYDITDMASPGADNLLAVRVDPTSFEGWWYEGGGIYRHTRLVSVAPVHIAPHGVQIVTTVPDPGDGIRADAELTVSTSVENSSGTATEAILLSEVLDATSTVRAKVKQQILIGATNHFECRRSMRIPKAYLWSCDRPRLYRLRSSILQEGRIADQLMTSFGIRTIRFDPDRGFFLNGMAVKIRGTCNHQDFGGVGVALPDRVHEFRVRKLKEMGANAYRFSHHPMAPELLETCDRLGMLVMDENRFLGDSAEILGQAESMVLRDRNHPCVVLWSLCNEEKEQGTALGARQARAMVEVIRRLDPTRPITAAMNGSFDAGISEVVDILGFNYHSKDYDWVRKKFPNKLMIATETAAAVSTRGVYARNRFEKQGDQYEGDLQTCALSAYGVNAPSWGQDAEPAWRAIIDRPWMAGCFVWTGFDYRGEPTPFTWPAIGSQFGILDICGFPKDAFYYYQAWWTKHPVLHVFPHWNWPGKEGREIEVWVYTNCDEVELFVNEKSVGKQGAPLNGHLEWRVPYAPGKLVAKGGCNGKQFTAKVETTGPPAALMLEPDKTTPTADASDVSLVEVSVVDSHGRIVPVSSDEVTFTVNGAGCLLGVGNGEPAGHESDKATRRRVFNGRCLAIVQASRAKGEITVMAQAAGLRSATATINAR